MQRVEQVTSRVAYRRSTVRRRLFVHGRGFICVNDGVAFASRLARHRRTFDSQALPRGAGSPRSGEGRREGEPPLSRSGCGSKGDVLVAGGLSFAACRAAHEADCCSIYAEGRGKIHLDHLRIAKLFLAGVMWNAASPPSLNAVRREDHHPRTGHHHQRVGLPRSSYLSSLVRFEKFGQQSITQF